MSLSLGHREEMIEHVLGLDVDEGIQAVDRRFRRLLREGNAEEAIGLVVDELGGRGGWVQWLTGLWAKVPEDKRPKTFADGKEFVRVGLGYMRPRPLHDEQWWRTVFGHGRDAQLAREVNAARESHAFLDARGREIVEALVRFKVQCSPAQFAWLVADVLEEKPRDLVSWLRKFGLGRLAVNVEALGVPPGGEDLLARCRSWFVSELPVRESPRVEVHEVGSREWSTFRAVWGVYPEAATFEALLTSIEGEGK